MRLKRALLLFVGLVFAVSALPRPLADVRLELEGHLAMSAEIQNALRVFGEESGETEELRLRLKAINQKYFLRLEEIVRVHGWPQETQMGAAAAEGALLVAMSAEAAEQRRMLPVLMEQAQLFELRRSSIAEIEDRVLVYEGKPQKYGSQFYVDAESGIRHLYPIADCGNVEFLRRSVELEPLSKFTDALGITDDRCKSD